MQSIREYLTANVPLGSVIGLFAVVTALYVTAYLLSRRGNGKMDQHNSPESKEQRAVADALNNALYSLLEDGKISEIRYNHYCSKLGKLMKLPGLNAKSIHPNAEYLKSLIRRRLANGNGINSLAALETKEQNIAPPIVRVRTVTMKKTTRSQSPVIGD